MISLRSTLKSNAYIRFDIINVHDRKLHKYNLLFRKYLCYILTFDPATKMLFLGNTPEGSDTFQRPVIERDHVGGLRLMIWEKVKVPFCHYSHAPEESIL